MLQFTRRISAIPALIIALVFTSGCAGAQEFKDGTKIFVVRHAEKEKGTDPVLSAAGISRSLALRDSLAGTDIDKIYVSYFKRTQLTAEPVRVASGADTIHYSAEPTGADLVKEIRKRKVSGNILVVGHSNTILPILKQFGVEGITGTDVPDNDYDNLFVITFKNGKAVLERKTYGAPDPQL